MTQRRQRVRRLALEDSGRPESASKESSTSKPAATKRKRTTKAKKTAYASSALRRHQHKTTDLIPKRPLAITLAMGVLVVAIALFNYLATLNPISMNSSSGCSSVLALNGTGSLSSWFSSFLLILSGLASLQIYALRQHRNDDYRGSYRIWIWMAVIFLLASMNSVVDFGELFSTLAGSFFDTAGTSPQAVFWWLFAAKIIALTGLVVRGVFELRASKSALVMVALVWIAYATSLVIQIPQAHDSIVSNYETVYGNCLLIGTVSVFMMVVFYARYVFLAANGLLDVRKKPAKKKKPARKKKAAAVATTKTTPKSNKAAVEPAESANETVAPVRIAKATTKSESATKKSKPVEPAPVQEQSAPAKRSGLRSPLAAKMQSMQQDEEPSSEAFSSEEPSNEHSEILSLRDKKSLSKSERKRLKKLERRVDQRRAA